MIPEDRVSERRVGFQARAFEFGDRVGIFWTNSTEKYMTHGCVSTPISTQGCLNATEKL